MAEKVEVVDSSTEIIEQKEEASVQVIDDKSKLLSNMTIYK